MNIEGGIMGKVYLVGAGPGDPGLLTIKAKECLEQADIVIYDYLANEKLLDYVKPQAKRIYVGKKAGQHTLKQEEINRLLVESAQTYPVAVRLKGGDPFLFGRGGEEALELVKHNIPFEVVPGISSGLAATAYAGIPVTHRELASSVAFITGHEAQKTQGSASVDWRRVAKSCDTLVIFMGVKNLPNIAHELLSSGVSEDTPVAVIRKGTYPSQRTIAGTLKNIVQLSEEHNITPPAIIVVGDVVKLREHLIWFEHRPLFGKTVVVTRNKTSEKKFTKLLEQQGANVFHFPTIDIVEIQPNNKLEQALNTLNLYDWLLFTSGNAVEIFFDQLLQAGYDMRSLRSIKIVAIGKPSAEKLQQYYLKADFIPSVFTSEELIAGMIAKYSLSEKRIVFPGSTLANPGIAESLRKAGAHIDVIPIYETKIAHVDKEAIDELKTLIKQQEIHWITFTSSSTVNNFVELIGSDFIIENKDKIPIASIGPVTTKTLKQYDLHPSITAHEHTFEGLVNSIIREEEHYD
jgi:uroporphyrinogen III methyltransferase/synthase